MTTDILANALRKWKCPGCGGSGAYQQNAVGRQRAVDRGRTPDPAYCPPPVECKVCQGLKLHPTASEALIRAGEPLDAPS